MTPTERVEKLAKALTENVIVYFVQIDDPRRAEFYSNMFYLVKSAISLTRREALLEAVEIADQFSKVGMSGALTATDITRRITALADKESERG